MYAQLSKCITTSRASTSDTIMRVLIVETELKSGTFNENLLMYCKGKEAIYNSEVYEDCTTLKECMPEKAIEQAHTLIQEGGKQDLKTRASVIVWVIAQLGLPDCYIPRFE